MFLSRNKKNNEYPCKPQFMYKKWGLRGSKLYTHVFLMHRSTYEVLNIFCKNLRSLVYNLLSFILPPFRETLFQRRQVFQNFPSEHHTRGKLHNQSHSTFNGRCGFVVSVKTRYRFVCYNSLYFTESTK